jgi:hypothetical protein
MVHAGGRPRTVSPSIEEMIALGEEMVKWVIENKPFHLSMWYTMEKDITDNEWDTYRKRPEFVHYYSKALKLVGYNYLDKESQVDVRIKDRWQRVYFKDLKEEEDQTKTFESNLKKAENKEQSADINTIVNAINAKKPQINA